MGLLVPGQVFGRVGYTDRLNARTARAAAADQLMAETRRELAVLSADMVGAQSYFGDLGTAWGGPARASRKLFRDTIEDAADLFMVIDPRPGLHIVDVNDRYAAATLTTRRQAAGSKLFELFPDNPGFADADGVGNLFESIQRAAQSGRPHEMAIQRYDVQDAAGQFVEKHWKCTNIPVLDDQGRLAFVLHHAADVSPTR